MAITNILSTIFDNIVPFTILLGVLVFVHELGHFVVARLCGVRVEVFSLGFGKKILSYKKGDTVYCISLIPLGGYVKMYGEQPGDEIPDNLKSVSFTHKNVWQRIAIVLAGPLMNLFFAVLVFGFIFYRGEDVRSARLAEIQPGSVAEKAGLQSLDKVLKINDQSVKTYEELQNIFNENINKKVTLTVQQDQQAERTVSAEITGMANPNPFTTKKTIGNVDGIMAYAKGTLIAVKTDSFAQRAGFKTGDEIIKISSKKAAGWSSLTALLDKAQHQVEVERTTADPDKKEKITLQVQAPEVNTFATMEDFGIEHPDLYLDQVVKDSPAEKAGLQKFDKIVSINNVTITAWEQVLNQIKSYDGKEALTVVISRDGAQITKKLTPQMTSQMTLQGKEDRRYTIGIVSMVNIAQPELIFVSADNIFQALYKGWNRSMDISAMTVMSFVRLFQGEVSHKNIGGMISIGKAAKDSYQMGLQAFLMTMGILSISLFILNLLPVPVLDGGHLVFYLIEIAKGSPLTGKKLEIAHQVGFALLMGLMFLALFNDITKFLF